MGINQDGVDYVSAPKDYDELFRIYYPYVVALVKKNGISDRNKEDVAAEILTRLYERNFLALFNPDMTFTHGARTHKARFKTFLSYSVIGYCMSARDKETRLNNRENLLMDSPTSYFDIDSTWAEWWGVEATDSHEDEILDMVEGNELVADIRAYLATIPRRNPSDRCDLVALFDAVVRQIASTGKISVKELKTMFDIKGTGINSWMWWLKGNLSQYLGVPLPPRRRRMTAEQ